MKKFEWVEERRKNRGSAYMQNLCQNCVRQRTHNGNCQSFQCWWLCMILIDEKSRVVREKKKGDKHMCQKLRV